MLDQPVGIAVLTSRDVAWISPCPWQQTEEIRPGVCIYGGQPILVTECPGTNAVPLPGLCRQSREWAGLVRELLRHGHDQKMLTDGE